MSELPPDPVPTPPLAVTPVRVRRRDVSSTGRLVMAALLAVLAVLALAALGFAWRANQRVGSFEQEIVRRQQDSAGQANEARLTAKDAQDSVRDASAKIALLEARVSEVSVQRGQLEELIQSMSRSRDENLLGDVEAAVRIAQQQTVITGSAEPLVAALKQIDERLARYNEPRLEGVRRAVARDLDRIKAVSVTDVSSLGIKLDDAIRMVDDLPLMSSADVHREPAVRAPNASPASPAASAALGVAALASWTGKAGEWWDVATFRAWSEVKSLVRVTRIDNPDAMLLAPEQAFFVRENLKLRLLNARLALLSRQFDTAQSDLTVARTSLERYFDRGSKRTALAVDLVKQVSGQARQIVVPRPDDTLAALTAAAVVH